MKRFRFFLFVMVSLLVCVDSLYALSNEEFSSIVERGNELVELIEKHFNAHSTYPKALDELKVGTNQHVNELLKMYTVRYDRRSSAYRWDSPSDYRIYVDVSKSPFYLFGQSSYEVVFYNDKKYKSYSRAKILKSYKGWILRKRKTKWYDSRVIDEISADTKFITEY